MTTPTSRQPTHRLYLVKGDDEHARWTEIGAAWSNRDGQGFSISLDAVPLGGRIVMRDRKLLTVNEEAAIAKAREYKKSIAASLGMQ